MSAGPGVRHGLSRLEQRAAHAREFLSGYLDYSENAPKWPAHLARELFERAAPFPSCYPPAGGLPQLIEALCERERARHRVDLGPQHVLVTNGALHGLSLVFRMLAHGDDLAVCQIPVFRSVAHQLRATGFAVRPLDCGGDRDALVDEVERLLRARQPRLLYLNIPNNPSGEVIAPETITRLVDACVARGCAVVADLVYDDFVHADPEVRHPLAATERWEQVFVVNSVSKNYGAPGLRVGWVTSHPRNIAALTALLERECIAVSATSQLGALDLIRHGNAELRDTVQRGERLVHDLAGRLPQLELSHPAAGTQCLLRLARGDVSRFADHVLRRHHVLVATSEGYEGCPVAHVRIPYGYPEAVIRPALERIACAVAQREDLEPPSSEPPPCEGERPLTDG